jgi:hypothetical protein
MTDDALPEQLTIFVNTSDNFEDCWDPFFKLFHQYWPNCPYNIVLNTETKDYQFEGLNISCTKVSASESRRLGWSECLQRALEQITTPYIFYIQEDYFLEAPVRADMFQELFNQMRLADIDVLQLRPAIGALPIEPPSSPLIWSVPQKAKWRVNLQVGLWKKDILKSQIRLHETPWQLESYGSFRSRRMNEKICCVSADLFGDFDKEVFPYHLTGVIAGKWVREIVEPLFLRHGIALDFSVRGFYDKFNKVRKRKNFFLRLIDRVRSL